MTISFIMGNTPANSMPTPPKTTEDRAVDAFVERLLAIKDGNIRFIPDTIERKTYERIVRHIIASLKEAIKTFSVSFLGMTFTIKIEHQD